MANKAPGRTPTTFSLTQEDLKEVDIMCPISRKQETYINDQDNDIIVYGGQAGAGKTEVSILRMLACAMTDPDYTATIFRQSKVQLKTAGGLFQTATRYFTKHAGASVNKIDYTWTFPNGVELKCHYLDNNTDDLQGMQCTEFFVDEATQCKEEDVMYLMSRLRSKSRKKHQLRMMTNPKINSFLHKFLEKGGYLDGHGYPVPEMDGVTTFMLQIGGEWRFEKDINVLVEEYGENAREDAYRFVFYGAGVMDNPYIRKYLPGYIRKLENMPPEEKKQLRDGCWKAKAEASGFFKREWVTIIPPSEVPLHLQTLRAWDLAGTLPDKGNNKDPDWTRGVKGCFDKETGHIYILDMVSARNRAAIIQNLMEHTATAEPDTLQSIPQDPGAAGKEVVANKLARFSLLKIKAVVTRPSKAKLERATPFLIAAQNRQVFVVNADWNEAFFEEFEQWDGKSKSRLHDDIVDATADMHYQLTSNNIVPTVKFNKQRAQRFGGGTLL